MKTKTIVKCEYHEYQFTVKLVSGAVNPFVIYETEYEYDHDNQWWNKHTHCVGKYACLHSCMVYLASRCHL